MAEGPRTPVIQQPLLSPAEPGVGLHADPRVWRTTPGPMVLKSPIALFRATSWRGAERVAAPPLLRKMSRATLPEILACGALSRGRRNKTLTHRVTASGTDSRITVARGRLTVAAVRCNVRR